MKKSFVILFSFSLFLMGCEGAKTNIGETLGEINVKDSTQHGAVPTCTSNTTPRNSNVSSAILYSSLLNSSQTSVTDPILVIDVSNEENWDGNNGNGSSVRIYYQIPEGYSVNLPVKIFYTSDFGNTCDNNVLSVVLDYAVDSQASLRTEYFDLHIEANDWISLEDIVVELVDAQGKTKKRVVASNPDSNPFVPKVVDTDKD